MKINSQKYFNLDKHIYVIENFLEQSMLDELIEQTTSELDWNLLEGPFVSNRVCLVKNTEISNLIQNSVSDLFWGQYDVYDGDTIVRQSPGDQMHVHCDNPWLDNVLSESSVPENAFNIWGSVLYLNEFEGGEIYYPRLNIQYKPKPGDLIIHPTISLYEHGTKPVLGSNKRYIMPIWLRLIYSDSIGS